MKLVISRKNTSKPVNEAELINILNSGFGSHIKILPDNEVSGFIETQAIRGNICYSFDYTGSFQAQTTVIQSEAA